MDRDERRRRRQHAQAETWRKQRLASLELPLGEGERLLAELRELLVSAAEQLDASAVCSVCQRPRDPAAWGNGRRDVCGVWHEDAQAAAYECSATQYRRQRDEAQQLAGALRKAARLGDDAAAAWQAIPAAWERP